MKCSICDSEVENDLENSELEDLCRECRDLIVESQREIEDWEGEFVRDLQDPPDLS